MDTCTLVSGPMDYDLDLVKSRNHQNMVLSTLEVGKQIREMVMAYMKIKSSERLIQ